MTIERVNVEDAEELLRIYSYYVEKTAISFEYLTPSVQEFAERIRLISSKYPYFKAVENGRIIGYAYANTFKAREAYDWSVETTIYIDKDHKGLGAGRGLYMQLEKSLAAMGILNMNACIACPVGDEDEYVTNDSMHFHEKMDFKLVGRFHNSGYKFNRWYDMIWMEKLIGEHTDRNEPVNFGKWC